MFLIVEYRLINNVHNIPTHFKISSKRFHKVAFIYKSRMGGVNEKFLFSLLARLLMPSI